jgi:hypothetical protein
MGTKTNKLNNAAYDLADLLNYEQLDYSGGLRNFIRRGEQDDDNDIANAHDNIIFVGKLKITLEEVQLGEINYGNTKE